MKKILIFAFIASMAFLFSSCSESVPPSTVNSVDDLDNKTIGVIENTVAVYYASGYGTLRQYATGDAMIADLLAGVIDCAIADEAASSKFSSRKIKILDDPFISVDFCIVTAKESRDLLEDIDAALAELSLDGTLAALENHYFQGTPYTPKLDIHENVGTLRLAVSGEFPPYSITNEDGTISGFDVTLARAICDRLGVNLEIIKSDQPDIMRKVWSSKADFGMGGLYRTAAADELVDFSEGYAPCRLRIITRK